MYEIAIAQLTIVAENCERNAPIHESEGNAEQAAHSRANGNAYRAAITALRGIGEETAGNFSVSTVKAQAMDMALRTPGSHSRDHHDVLFVAKLYEQYLTGK